jgi:hypothetical protein
LAVFLGKTESKYLAVGVTSSSAFLLRIMR